MLSLFQKSYSRCSNPTWITPPQAGPSCQVFTCGWKIIIRSRTSIVIVEPTGSSCAPIIRMSTGGGMPIDGIAFALAGVAGDTNEMVFENDPVSTVSVLRVLMPSSAFQKAHLDWDHEIYD